MFTKTKQTSFPRQLGLTLLVYSRVGSGVTQKQFPNAKEIQIHKVSGEIQATGGRWFFHGIYIGYLKLSVLTLPYSETESIESVEIRKVI